MCGIAGIVKRSGRLVDEADRRAIGAMVAAMNHRGPDAQGFWESPDGSCIFGHARLSIIDVSGSPQPMIRGDDGLTYNGEVYNFREIRSELAAKGAGFRTGGDTEVVLEALRARGAGAVELLDGMFALGFWKHADQRLFLARDPFGIKPLYYTVTEHSIAFASELTPLRAVPGIDLSIADDAVIEYLLYGYVPSPKSIVSGAKKLPPGHWLAYDRMSDAVTVQRYWTPTFEVEEHLTEEHALDMLDQALDRAVGSHLVSDVPLGAFLSGGIDSSLVVSYMVRHGNHRAFTARFDEEAFDESLQAEAVARHVNAELVKCPVAIGDSVRLTDKLGVAYDEPFSDSSALPTYLVCEAMRRYVTVALSGDGGDEVFGGYLRYQKLMERSLSAPEGAFGQRVARTLRNVLPTGSLPWRRLNDRSSTPVEYYQRLQRIFAEEHLASVLREPGAFGAGARTSLLSDLMSARGNPDLLSNAQLCDITTYLPEDCLTKVDRASMAHSLEVRVPFLSREIWSVARRLPTALRVGQGAGRNKVLLRALAKRRLPSDVVGLPKKGFSIPAAEWFRGALMDRFHELATDSPIIRTYCSETGLNRLMNEHRSGARNHHHRLWNLMMLALWYEKHGTLASASSGGPTPRPVGA